MKERLKALGCCAMRSFKEDSQKPLIWRLAKTPRSVNSLSNLTKS